MALSFGLVIVLLITVFIFNPPFTKGFGAQNKHIEDMYKLADYLVQNGCYHNEVVDMDSFNEYYYTKHPKRYASIGYTKHPIEYTCNNNEKITTTLLIADLLNPNLHKAEVRGMHFPHPAISKAAINAAFDIYSDC